MKKRKFIIKGAVIIVAVLLCFFIKIHSDETRKPQLLRLYSQESSDHTHYNVKLTFRTSPGHVCYIYRKIQYGRYSCIGKVLSSRGITEYRDSGVLWNRRYSYTVRQRGNGLYHRRLSGYDHEGIQIIGGTPVVIAYSGNLNTRIRWSINSQANGYRIYRRMENSRWTLIGETGRDTTTFTDVYRRTFSSQDKREYLSYGCYLDNSSHSLSYMVRAVRRSNDSDKISMSPYQRDGYYNLNAPIIVDYEDTAYMKGQLTFTSVPYASLYRIQLVKKKKDGEPEYITYTTIRSSKDAYISCDVPVLNGYDYCVVAYADRNDRQITRRSSSFTLKYRSNSSHNILYIGDSITYGSPYKTELTRYIFSYPWRVSELTGCDYYNAAIPGATMAYSTHNYSSFHRYRIIRDVVPEISMGTTPVASPGLLDKNTEKFEDFDTIVILAGTNDYTDMIPLGSTDSMNDTTYCGALNSLLDTIEKASLKRIASGRKPISVVMPDLFYSDRCRSFGKRQNRFVTRNGIGYTLRVYRRAEHSIADRYRKKGMKIYRFRTDRYVNEKNCPYTTADNLHMTRYTYEKIGDSLAAFLVKRVWNLSENS